MAKLLSALTLGLILAGASLLHSSPAAAKGPMDMIIGGGELAPYFYAVDMDSPGGMVFPATPMDPLAGEVPSPPNSSSMLASAYAIYFEMGDILYAAPPLSYVPSTDSHGAYFVWHTTCWWEHPCETEADVWIEAPADQVTHIDELINDALARKAAGGEGLELDPLQAMVRRADSFRWRFEEQGEYLLGHGTQQFSDKVYGSPEWRRLPDEAVDPLIEALQGNLTANRWHSLPEFPPGSESTLRMAAISSWEIFTYEPPVAGQQGRVILSDAMGYFEATEEFELALDAAAQSSEAIVPADSWSDLSPSFRGYVQGYFESAYGGDTSYLKHFLTAAPVFAFLHEGTLSFDGRRLTAAETSELRAALRDSLSRYQWSGRPVSEDWPSHPITNEYGDLIFDYRRNAENALALHVPTFDGYFWVSPRLEEVVTDLLWIDAEEELLAMAGDRSPGVRHDGGDGMIEQFWPAALALGLVATLPIGWRLLKHRN